MKIEGESQDVQSVGAFLDDLRELISFSASLCGELCEGREWSLRGARWNNAEWERMLEAYNALVALSFLAEDALKNLQPELEMDQKAGLLQVSEDSKRLLRKNSEGNWEDHALTRIRSFLSPSQFRINEGGDIWNFKNIEQLELYSVGAPIKYEGVYFLLEEGQVIYVGQSKDLGARILTHRTSKSFDRYATIPVHKDWLNEVEAEYILYYRPHLNRSLPQNSWYQTAEKAKISLNLRTKQDVYEQCIELSLEPIIFGGELYYPVKEMVRLGGVS